MRRRKKSQDDHGYQSERILRAWHKDLTVGEVAERARVDYETTRRVLAYHKKKCLSQRDRIRLLKRQLNDKMAEMSIVMPMPDEMADRALQDRRQAIEILSGLVDVLRAEKSPWYYKRLSDALKDAEDLLREF